jgi:hypothetical protein
VVCGRITDLEIALAQTQGVRVHHIVLSSSGLPGWDFSNTPALIGLGYAQMQRKFEEWLAEEPNFLSLLST